MGKTDREMITGMLQGKHSMTNQDLCDKMEWEGGLDDIIDYGIKASDIYDAETATIYAEVIAAYAVYDEVRERFCKRVNYY